MPKVNLIFFVVLASLFFSNMSRAVTIDENIPVEIKQLILSDLDSLRNIAGDGATMLNGEEFGPGFMSGRSYYRFFEERVKAIGYDNSEQKRGVAYSAVYNGKRSKLWITKAYASKKYPRVLRLSILLHEAQHCDVTSSWLHSRCPSPFRDEAGQDIVDVNGKLLAGREVFCDADEHGSYGVQFVFLKNVEKYCTNCSPEDKNFAAIWADETLKHVSSPHARANLLRDSR